MKLNTIIILFLHVVLFGCNSQQQSEQTIFLAQGIMSGEPTDNSIILQSRLTAVESLTDKGDILGTPGVGRFEISDNDQFENGKFSEWLTAKATGDFILKYSFENLTPAKKYFYRLHFGENKNDQFISDTGVFKTNPGAENSLPISFVVVTGMNNYFFNFGKYNRATAYAGNDKALGFPALKSILDQHPDFFIGTGDNVYFDHPSENNFKSNLKKGNDPDPSWYGGKEVLDEAGMRQKYHEQFSQPRFVDLFRETATYWEKDDHDYRENDADPYSDFPISHELGIKNFKEQLPVVDPVKGGKTYRTHRISKDLQLWFVEGRDYRDANDKPDGPGKTLWGVEQLAWLQRTLLASDATFKILVSPTPMVGPDDAYKKDNHVNHDGFRHEGEAFFDWVVDNGLLDNNFYIICGDRHWQYHATHPKGVEEFSTGALVENNSRAGRVAGDPNSTDPEGKIVQHYVQGKPEDASGGFLTVKVIPEPSMELQFLFYDEHGSLLYSTSKNAH